MVNSQPENRQKKLSINGGILVLGQREIIRTKKCTLYIKWRQP